jgi:hypothetical protein
MSESEVLASKLHRLAKETRLKVLAQLIAAERMSLVSDPLGANLPDDLWMQCTATAEAVMQLIQQPNS